MKTPNDRGAAIMPDLKSSQGEDRSCASGNSALRPADHLNGASIIDAQGREIPITEEMVQRALDEAHRCWQSSGTRQVEVLEP